MKSGRYGCHSSKFMRRDLHSLFDAGYVTITPGMRFEVSRRIKEEFDDGRQYYQLHGREIALPDDQRRKAGSREAGVAW